MASLHEQIALVKELKDKLRPLEARVTEQMQERARQITRADETKMIDYQARADATYKDLGHIGAPPPLPSEYPSEYRRRLAKGLQEFGRFVKARLDSLPDAGLEEIEDIIYADAAAAAATPKVPPGEMISRTKQGHNSAITTTEFFGSPSAWMDEMAGPVRQYVKAIGTYRFDDYLSPRRR